MFAEYFGAKREPRPDDIAGNQHIHGPAPEPSSLLALSPALVLLMRRRVCIGLGLPGDRSSCSMMDPPSVMSVCPVM